MAADHIGSCLKRRIERVPKRDSAPPLADLELVQAARNHDDRKMDLKQPNRQVRCDTWRGLARRTSPERTPIGRRTQQTATQRLGMSLPREHVADHEIYSW